MLFLFGFLWDHSHTFLIALSALSFAGFAYQRQVVLRKTISHQTSVWKWTESPVTSPWVWACQNHLLKKSLNLVVTKAKLEVSRQMFLIEAHNSFDVAPNISGLFNQWITHLMRLLNGIKKRFCFGTGTYSFHLCFITQLLFLWLSLGLSSSN